MDIRQEIRNKIKGYWTGDQWNPQMLKEYRAIEQEYYDKGYRDAFDRVEIDLRMEMKERMRRY